MIVDDNRLILKIFDQATPIADFPAAPPAIPQRLRVYTDIERHPLPDEAAPLGPHLKISGTEGGRYVPLLKGNFWRLGRGPESAVVLQDELVSRNHAMIQRMEHGDYYLIDMGSRNGSLVNERRVGTPVALRDGDRLKVGSAEIIFCNPSAARPASVPANDNGAATICDLRRCLVSVLVIDMRGFAVLSQQIDNALLCQMMGSWFGEADRIMRKHGSTAEKYLGDAVMAVWEHSAKGRESEEILNILLALAEFVEFTEALGARFAIPGGLHVGAGLNTGSATVGNTGASQVTDYTAHGECVNAAFRLESATKSLQTDLCLGKATSDFLRSWPAAAAYLRETDVELKGYTASVRTCPATFLHLKRFLDSLDYAETAVC